MNLKSSEIYKFNKLCSRKLRSKIDRFFCVPNNYNHFQIDMFENEELFTFEYNEIGRFLQYTDQLSDGGLYVFGGILRDFSLFGRKGFSSDIDIVVDRNWYSVVAFLVRQGFVKNKFGGFRGIVSGVLVDVWYSEETWAFKYGGLKYVSVKSLLYSTITNWDAILFKWSDREVIASDNYFYDLKYGRLTMVFDKNPNEIGLLIRVLRYFSRRLVRQTTSSLLDYIAYTYSFYDDSRILQYEYRSYGSNLIDGDILEFFEIYSRLNKFEHERRINFIEDWFEYNSISYPFKQLEIEC